MVIEEQEEFARDWDWYAVDQDGRLGHLVAVPDRVLFIDDLPLEISGLVSHTFAALRLMNYLHIDEATTTTW